MSDANIIEINGVEVSLEDAKAREDIETINTQLGDIAKQVENVGNPTDEQISTAVNNYLTKNPIESDISSITEQIKSNNLFDVSKKVTSFTDNNGSTITGNFTNYIKLKKGQRYVTNLNYTQYYIFNENKQCTSSATYITSPVIINGNGGYMLIKRGSEDDSAVKILEGTDPESLHLIETMLKNSKIQPISKWYGKRWLLIGDSISTDNAGLATNGYGKLISRELGMILTNISISGKTMKDGYEWLDSCSEQFDLITVMMGTNNQGYNCGIGSLNDSYYTAGTYDTNSSFYAQVQLMIEKLKTKYPKSVIIFLTPIRRTSGDGNNNNNDEGCQLNALNKTTKDYRDVIINCCNYYTIPYIDLYNVIDPRTETNRELYFVSKTDGCHPNDLGHALFLAPVIKDEIEKHAPYYFNDWNNGGGSDTPVTPTNYTITNNLTNVVNSNTATSVEKDSSYTTTLTADAGYTLGDVTVTMGGTDITSTAYSNGVITISSVTGNIVITATATKNTTPEVTGLIHSYDMTNLTTVATVLEDLINDFNLDCVAVTEDDVNNKYYSCGSGTTKKISKNRNSNFLLGDTSKDFTLAIHLKAQDIYSTGNLHTGLTNAFNVTTTDYPSTDGRFTIKQSAESGAIATGINLNYYDSTGKILKEHYWNGYIAQSDFDVHVIRFKLDTLTVQLDRYMIKDGVLDHITETLNVENGLRFDGINILGNISIKHINIYADVETDSDIETLAKSWLGID